MDRRCPASSVVQLPFGVLDPEAADGVARTPPEHAASRSGPAACSAAGCSTPASATPDFDDPKLPLIRRLQEIAGRHGVGLDQLAIGFVQSVPALSAMLVGINTTSHLHRYLELAAAGPLDAELRDEVRAALDQAGAAGG